MDTTHPPAAVEARQLTKRYGRTTVVRDVSFRVPAGSVSGLVGPNGAGKTTVMAMLLGLVRVTRGGATVLGEDIARPSAYLPRVGALIEAPAFYPALSGEDNLRHRCLLAGISAHEVPDLLELVGLGARGRDRYAGYSLGMKQRLAIASALLGDPDLVVLDEPTNGVDPQGMKDIRAIVRTVAGQGRTVLVSSHLLAELEAVCDHLVVLDHGGCRYAGPVHGLGVRGGVITLASTGAPALLVAALADAGIPASVDGARVTVAGPVTDGGDLAAYAAHLNATAHAAGITLTELHPHTQSLEDRVLDLVGTGATS